MSDLSREGEQQLLDDIEAKFSARKAYGLPPGGTWFFLVRRKVESPTTVFCGTRCNVVRRSKKDAFVECDLVKLHRSLKKRLKDKNE